MQEGAISRAIAASSATSDPSCNCIILAALIKVSVRRYCFPVSLFVKDHVERYRVFRYSVFPCVRIHVLRASGSSKYGNVGKAIPLIIRNPVVGVADRSAAKSRCAGEGSSRRAWVVDIGISLSFLAL